MFQPTVFQEAAVEDVCRPDRGQRGMVERHVGCEPNQPEETEVHRMTDQFVRTARLELPAWSFLPTQPVVKRSPSVLIAETGQSESVKQRISESVDVR